MTAVTALKSRGWGERKTNIPAMQMQKVYAISISCVFTYPQTDAANSFRAVPMENPTSGSTCARYALCMSALSFVKKYAEISATKKLRKKCGTAENSDVGAL